MITVRFITPAGKKYMADGTTGQSIMDVAVKHNIPGILAECGGACACATCHVYLPDDWKDRVPSQSPIEASMLEFADHVTDNSRLSCQIRLNESLDGICVILPESYF